MNEINDEYMNLENITNKANSEFDEKYLDEYRKGVFSQETIEEIEQVLPDSRFNGYFQIMKYLKVYAELECQTILNEINDCNSVVPPDDLEYLKKELSKYKSMLVLFNSKIADYLEEEKESTELKDVETERKLIYLKSPAGNILFERDLEGIPFEEMQDMADAFDFLRFGDFSSDETKFRKLSYLNSLKNILEVKNYQSRIYFYRLENDIMLVVLGKIKKSDFSLSDYNSICNRASSANKLIKSLRTDLKNPQKREELITEGNTITDRIIEKFNGLKKGKK